MFEKICFCLFWLFVTVAMVCFAIQLMFALDKVYHFLPI